MLIMRVNRFVHHCDMIFDSYVKNHNTQKVNTHHQDYYSASLLLSLHYPSKYCLFNYDLFENFCKEIEVNQLPVNTDLERYYKILRPTYNIISKDEKFMNTYYELLEDDIYMGPSLDITYDMMQFNARNAG